MKMTNETLNGNYQLAQKYAARYYERSHFLKNCGVALEGGRKRKAYLVPGTQEAENWAQLCTDIERLARWLESGEVVAYTVYQTIVDEDDGTFYRRRVGDLFAHRNVTGWGLAALCEDVYGLGARDGVCFRRLSEKIKRHGRASKAALDERWERVRENERAAELV